MSDASYLVRVRMYRVGFGDCFLLSLKTAGGPRHILVDCGVHTRGDVKTLAAVVENIAVETEGKLALVVMTHRHQDHISGFGRYAEQFAKLEVGEVWMPWVEDPAEARADEGFQASFAALVRRLGERLDEDPEADPETRDRLENITPAASSGEAALAGNDRALEVLRGGFKSAGSKPYPVRYLGAGDRAPAPAALAGLAVRVLGPPRDPALLAKMNPPAHEHYLAASSPSDDPPEDAAARPFDDVFVASDEEYRHDVKATPEDLDKIGAAIFPSLDALVASMDNAINNQSLVLLFSFGGVNLLFPGDAQWGSWESWLYQRGPGGNEDSALAEESKRLLASVHFYKVSHHGSVNATPVDVVQGLTQGSFAAMCSTQSVPWASIPRGPLMSALEDRSAQRLVRSDSLSLDGAPAGPPVAKLPSGFSKGQLWIDYVFDRAPDPPPDRGRAPAPRVAASPASPPAAPIAPEFGRLRVEIDGEPARVLLDGVDSDFLTGNDIVRETGTYSVSLDLPAGSYDPPQQDAVVTPHASRTVSFTRT